MIEEVSAINILQRKSIKDLFGQNQLSWDNFEKDSKSFVDNFCQTTNQKIVLVNHYYNARLWAFEDRARDHSAMSDEIVKIKRSIDRLNQLRNDQIEKINQTIVEQLPAMNEKAPLFSETPGSIFDRLSILELKHFHMKVQVDRSDAEPSHKTQCQSRLEIIKAQRADLISALDYLFKSIQQGQMRFKLYYQIKMYNDPSLNPFLKK
jgi:hypothetical protein